MENQANKEMESALKPKRPGRMPEKQWAVITGADGGMGTEITRAVAQAGYRVMMLCYTQLKGEQRKSQLALATGNPNLEVMQVDLSSMASVMAVTDALLQRKLTIDLLMNNAGRMSTTGRVITEDRLEQTVAVNYVAPFLLTLKLLPLMHAGSRIVNMVSCTYAVGRITPEFLTQGRSGRFWRIPVYSNTKRALWYFTCTLAERIRERGITVNAADPGIVSTPIIHMDQWFDPLTDCLFRPCIRTPRQGADTAIRLLLEERWAGVTGQLFASGKRQHVKAKHCPLSEMQRLWNDTCTYLSTLPISEMKAWWKDPSD